VSRHERRYDYELVWCDIYHRQFVRNSIPVAKQSPSDTAALRLIPSSSKHKSFVCRVVRLVIPFEAVLASAPGDRQLTMR
jgi:hypothetical protein